MEPNLGNFDRFQPIFIENGREKSHFDTYLIRFKISQFEKIDDV